MCLFTTGYYICDVPLAACALAVVAWLFGYCNITYHFMSLFMYYYNTNGLLQMVGLEDMSVLLAHDLRIYNRFLL